MAGVISRSAYLEAKTPADGEEKGNSKRRLSVYFGISASSSRIWQSFPPFLYIGTPQYKVCKLWLLLKKYSRNQRMFLLSKGHPIGGLFF